MKLIIWIVTLIAATSQAGNSVGNGGDAVAADFVQSAKYAVGLLKKVSLDAGLSASLAAVEQSLQITKVNSAESLILNGDYVDAINYPADFKIMVSRRGWEILRLGSMANRLNLVLHEYLGISGLDDSKYQISQLLIPKISNQLVEGSVSASQFQNTLSTFIGQIYVLLADVSEMQDHPENSDIFCLDVGSINAYTNLTSQFVVGNLGWYLEQQDQAQKSLDTVTEISRDLNSQCVSHKIDLKKVEAEILSLSSSLKFLLEKLQFPLDPAG